MAERPKFRKTNSAIKATKQYGSLSSSPSIAYKRTALSFAFSKLGVAERPNCAKRIPQSKRRRNTALSQHLLQLRVSAQLSPSLFPSLRWLSAQIPQNEFRNQSDDAIRLPLNISFNCLYAHSSSHRFSKFEVAERPNSAKRILQSKRRRNTFPSEHLLHLPIRAQLVPSLFPSLRWLAAQIPQNDFRNQSDDAIRLPLNISFNCL